jgi:glycosyltransferase involved in cell wall biosynthesis
LALDYPSNRYEIIVVDNGSSDDTCQQVKKYPVKLLEE